MRFAFVVCVRWLSFLSTWWVWFGFVSFVNSVGMRGFCGCYVFWYLFAGVVVLFDSRSSVGWSFRLGCWLWGVWWFVLLVGGCLMLRLGWLLVVLSCAV